MNSGAIELSVTRFAELTLENLVLSWQISVSISEKTKMLIIELPSF